MSAPELGTLDWQPARDHGSWLAPSVVAALAASPIQAYVAAIDAALAGAAPISDAYEVPLTASANCVVVAGRRGETTTMAAVMVQASERADVNRAVRKHLDVRKISFAAMDDATRLTAMEYGGITPIGLPADWPVLVDSGVVAAGWVVIGSGIRGSKLAVRGAELAQLPGAQTLDLTVSAAG